MAVRQTIWTCTKDEHGQILCFVLYGRIAAVLYDLSCGHALLCHEVLNVAITMLLYTLLKTQAWLHGFCYIAALRKYRSYSIKTISTYELHAFRTVTIHCLFENSVA